MAFTVTGSTGFQIFSQISLFAPGLFAVIRWADDFAVNSVCAPACMRAALDDSVERFTALISFTSHRLQISLRRYSTPAHTSTLGPTTSFVTGNR